MEESKPAYITREQVLASTGYSQNFTHCQASNSYFEPVTDINIRAPYDRGVYEFFRPNETFPKKFKDVVLSCRKAYLLVGIIRNVIDMMTDFACEDLKLVDPDKKIQTFYRTWAKKVNLEEVCNELVRHLLIDGNVVIKRKTAKINNSIKQQWSKSSAAKVERYQDEETKLSKNEIPIAYKFLNVAAMEWVRKDDKKTLVFNPSRNIIKVDRQPVMRVHNYTADNLLNNSANNFSTKEPIELDTNKVVVIHNKKDSWDDWSTPFLISVISDIQFKNKLRQAEIAALDGVINVIRLWKLGDHQKEIFADEAAFKQLSNILTSNTGGGAIDIIWDSMIDMKPYYPPVAEILGSEKYNQVNKDILIGLGIPEVLIGGKGANFSNSYIQLKTLIEKLKYVRKKVEDFVRNEVKLIADAMGIKKLPRIQFSSMDVDDANTNKKLVIELLDRGIISVEAVLQVYGEDYLTEIERLKNEKQEFKEAGLEIKNPLNRPEKPSGANGRPPGAKDITKRKPKKVKIRTKGESLFLFAMDAIDSIEENIIPTYLDVYGIDNARKLTAKQKEEIDSLRIKLISCIKYKDDISKDGIVKILENCSQNNKELARTIRKSIAKYTSENSEVPTLEQKKRLIAASWAIYNGEENAEI